MGHKLLIFSSIMISVVLLSNGCGGGKVIRKPPVSMVTEQYVINEEEQLPTNTSAFMEQVVLGPGDVIVITSEIAPELNTTQQIRQDGKITLEYVDDVTAAGKTPLQFHDELVSMLSTDLVEPELIITLESLFSNRVFVGGDVGAPGVIETSGKITALESIIQSGGFNMETASYKKVVVIRNHDGYRTGFQLDMSPAINGLPHIPFYLEPFDIIYVPQMKVVRMNRWITQHIDNMLPEVLTGTLMSYLILDFVRQ